MPDPERISGAAVDLSPRVFKSATVAASPSAAAETVVCTLTIPSDVQANAGVLVMGNVAVTIGTSGVSLNLKLRQTGTSGTTLYATGATTVVAAQLKEIGAIAFDTAPVLPNQVYVITLTIGSGAAASTVSAAQLVAVVI